MEFLSPDQVPPNRREAHRRAVDLLDRCEATGQPFALVLRTYTITQLFGEADERFQASEQLENALDEELAPLGLGVVTVQAQNAVSQLQFLGEDAVNHEFEIRAPALYVPAEVWMTVVEHLITRAGLVVVLLSAHTPGVLWELDKLVELDQADRTLVVLFTAAWMDPLPELPVLERFLRVSFGHQLAVPGFADHFLVKDLVASMCSEHTSGRPEIDWSSMAAAYERTAQREWGWHALRDAAESFRRAARVSLRLDDHLAAARQTIKRATVLDALQDGTAARDVLHQLADHLAASTGRETALARAQLDAALARAMAASGEAGDALALLDQSRTRAGERDDPRSASILQTAKAWIRRGEADGIGAMTAAQEAVALAQRAESAAELWQSLIVLGIVWADFGEWFPHGMDTFARAVEAMPESGAEEDLWLVLMTLGRLAAQNGNWSAATRAYESAAQAATAANLTAEARTARERLLAVLPIGRQPGSGPPAGST
jgi:hypothetical protein